MASTKTVRKLKLQTEMRRLKRKTADPYDRYVLDWAMEWVKVGLAQTEQEQLERLYRLPDPRDNPKSSDKP